jgi:N utilization substance protein B
MGMRREGREAAIQFLFQHELNPQSDVEGSFVRYVKMIDLKAATAEFARTLALGVLAHQKEIDAVIISLAENWDFPRIANLDRNVLRLAIYEMLKRDDIPPVVSINEAIEIAKKFSTEDSGKFVNGILDKVKGGLNRPSRHIAGK